MFILNIYHPHHYLLSHWPRQVPVLLQILSCNCFCEPEGWSLSSTGQGTFHPFLNLCSGLSNLVKAMCGCPYKAVDTSLGQYCPKAARSLCHFSPPQEPCSAHFPSISRWETNNRTWAKGQVHMGTLKSFCSYRSCLPECRWIWLLFTRYDLCRQIWYSCHTSAHGGVRKGILPNVSRQR